jgi:microcystin-dependent protein
MDLTLKEKIIAGDQEDAYYFTGDIVSFHNLNVPLSSIPNGWLSCDGAQLLITSYQNLYDEIGYRYTPAGEQSSSPGYFRLPKLNNLTGQPTYQTNQWQSGGPNWQDSYDGHSHILLNVEEFTYQNANVLSQSGEGGHSHNSQVFDQNQAMSGHNHPATSFGVNTNQASSSGNYTGSNRVRVLAPRSHTHNTTGSINSISQTQAIDHIHTSNASPSTGFNSANESHTHTASLNVYTTNAKSEIPTVTTRYIIKV